MKHYLLSIYQPDEGVPENLPEIMREVGALNDEMRAAGAWVFAAGLHAPGTATVLHARDGDVLVTDGPYVEGKEHIGGFTVIRAADLDEALDWGRKLATVVGLPIEVRPIQDE
ncbi:YciI family protein [Nocardia sp. NPDC004573]